MADVTVRDAPAVNGPAAFAQWKVAHGLPADATTDDDTDHDGLGLLVEYALGTDPAANSAGAGPKVSVETVIGDAFLTLRVARAGLAPGVVYTVEVSGDPLAWNSGSGYTTTLTDTDTLLVVRDNVPLVPASGGRRFLRLRVALP